MALVAPVDSHQVNLTTCGVCDRMEAPLRTYLSRLPHLVADLFPIRRWGDCLVCDQPSRVVPLVLSFVVLLASRSPAQDQLAPAPPPEKAPAATAPALTT